MGFVLLSFTVLPTFVSGCGNFASDQKRAYIEEMWEQSVEENT